MNVSLKKYQLQDQKNTANAFKETKIEISLIKEYIQFPPKKRNWNVHSIQNIGKNSFKNEIKCN